MQNCTIHFSINSLYWWLSFAQASMRPRMLSDFSSKSVMLGACVCVCVALRPEAHISRSFRQHSFWTGIRWGRPTGLTCNVLKCSSVGRLCTLARACYICSLYATLSKNLALSDAPSGIMPQSLHSSFLGGMTMTCRA